MVIEDKTGRERNSLFGSEVEQTQNHPDAFAEKIRDGKAVQVSDDMMSIARIESLIQEKGVPHALERAQAEIEIDAGADGVMIHSRERNPKQLLEFTRRYRSLEGRVPLVVVPTSYNQMTDREMTEDELTDAGAQSVIYPNPLLRSVYPSSAYSSMWNIAESILRHGRSLEASDDCMPMRETLNLIPSAR